MQSLSSASLPTILAQARSVVEAELAKSTLILPRSGATAATTAFPRFEPDEIKTNRVVGRGGFCVVREIADIRLLRPGRHLQQQNPSDVALHAETTLTSEATSVPQTRLAASSPSTMATPTSSSPPTTVMSKNIRTKFWRWKRRRRNSSDVVEMGEGNRTTSLEHGEAGIRLDSVDPQEILIKQIRSKREKYVVKQVDSAWIHTNKVTFLKGIIDIAMEAKLLAALDHCNIIKLRGECNQSPLDCGANYFIILDHLPETLPRRLNAWMHRYRSNRGVTGLVLGSKKKVTELMMERLRVAYDIASAGEYLHDEKNIIFRDLKPDNIGFSSTGITQLIDFGLAKELTNEEMDEHGLFRLTGVTGGIRYMAPEVGRSMPYNLKADIYSWSMIMWYILALEPPLGLYPINVFIDLVFVKGYRPPIKDKWSSSLCKFLRQCWSEDMFERPTFACIKSALRKEMSFVNSDNLSQTELPHDEDMV